MFHEFVVTVNYDVSIEDMVEAIEGPTTVPKQFRRKDKDVTSKNFPCIHRGTIERKVIVYYPECFVRIKHVLHILRRENLQSGDVRELLAYGEKYLTVGIDSPPPITALGFIWRGLDGRQYAPSLYGDSWVKRVHLDWTRSIWSPRFGFIARPKASTQA